MKIKETKYVDCYKLRNMCVEYGWYTRGTNDDYEKMFAMCKKGVITTNKIYKISKNIYEHTCFKTAYCGCYPDCTDEENILTIMHHVNECVSAHFTIC